MRGLFSLRRPCHASMPYMAYWHAHWPFPPSRHPAGWAPANAPNQHHVDAVQLTDTAQHALVVVCALQVQLQELGADVLHELARARPASAASPRRAHPTPQHPPCIRPRARATFRTTGGPPQKASKMADYAIEDRVNCSLQSESGDMTHPRAFDWA